MDALKVLGQSFPAAATLTDMVTVGAAKSQTVSSIAACNQSATVDTIRISVAVAGAADTAKQYLVYDLDIDRADGPYIATIGVTLAATDVLRVRSLNGTSSFSAFGVEVS